MRVQAPHLADEHMNFYEWSGSRAVRLPVRGSRGNSRWHMSYAVLAALVSLLALGGCNNKGPAEQAGERVDEAVGDMKSEVGTLKDKPTVEPGPAQQAGETLDNAREATGEKLESMGESLQKQ